MKAYRKKHLQPMTPWVEGFDMTGVSVSEPDREDGSPKEGDMIAHNPRNSTDRWLIAADFFQANYEEADTLVDDPNHEGPTGIFAASGNNTNNAQREP